MKKDYNYRKDLDIRVLFLFAFPTYTIMKGVDIYVKFYY